MDGVTHLVQCGAHFRAVGQRVAVQQIGDVGFQGIPLTLQVVARTLGGTAELPAAPFQAALQFFQAGSQFIGDIVSHLGFLKESLKVGGAPVSVTGRLPGADR